MTEQHQLQNLRYFIAVAMPAVEALPILHRADAYDGIAAASRGYDEDLTTAAVETANALRAAEGRQANFIALIFPEPEN